jgi:hypothetical protein
MFCFALKDAISVWGENFVQFHLGCTFLELEATFYKCYCSVQNDEQVCKAFRVIKQGNNEKVEVYYEWMFKLANCFQHKVNDNLLTTFFRTRLITYSQIAPIGMKRDTLFDHKEFAITCEVTMANVEEYQKLYEP